MQRFRHGSRSSCHRVLTGFIVARLGCVVKVAWTVSIQVFGGRIAGVGFQLWGGPDRRVGFRVGWGLGAGRDEGSFGF